MMLTNTRNPGSTRRTHPFVTMGAFVIAVGMLLASCGEGSDASESSGGGSWTFTDGRGEKVSLDAPPEQIIAYDTAGAALWHLGVEPIGIFGQAPLDENPLLEGVDVSGIESVGEVYSEIDIEKVAELAPDLIVTAFSPNNPADTPLFGFKDLEQQEKLEAIAPIVAIEATSVPTTVISQFEKLASALGADLESEDLVADRQRFEESVEQLKSAIAENPDVEVLAIGAYGNEIYFARPEHFPHLRQYTEWGLNLVEPDSGDEAWQTASFEQADMYPADLILYDTRALSLSLDALNEKPTWQTLPAVEAGQTVGFSAQEFWSYELYGSEIETLAEAVANADDDVVS